MEMIPLLGVKLKLEVVGTVVVVLEVAALDSAFSAAMLVAVLELDAVEAALPAPTEAVMPVAVLLEFNESGVVNEVFRTGSRIGSVGATLAADGLEVKVVVMAEV